MRKLRTTINLKGRFARFVGHPFFERLKPSILWVSFFIFVGVLGTVTECMAQLDMAGDGDGGAPELFKVKEPIDGQQIEEGVPFPVVISSERPDLEVVTVYMGDQQLLDMPFPYLEGTVVVETLPSEPVLTLIGRTTEYVQQVVTKRLRRSRSGLYHADPVAKGALFSVVSPRDGEVFYYGDIIVFQGMAVAPELESIEIFLNGEPYTTLFGPEYYDHFPFPYDANTVELKAVAKVGDKEQIIERTLRRYQY